MQIKSKGRTALKFSVIAFLVTGCASQPPLVPVTDSDQRLEFNGFSVLPPMGPDWSWMGKADQNKRDHFSTTFVKKDGDRTYLAKADLINTEGMKIDDIENLISEMKTWEVFKEGPRQADMRLSIKIDNTLGDRCARYDFDAEDRQAPGKPGVIFNLDAHGYYCLHPQSPNVVAQAAYSRRAPKGQSHIAEVSEGERFIGSIEFTEVRK